MGLFLTRLMAACNFASTRKLPKVFAIKTRVAAICTTSTLFGCQLCHSCGDFFCQCGCMTYRLNRFYEARVFHFFAYPKIKFPNPSPQKKQKTHKKPTTTTNKQRPCADLIFCVHYCCVLAVFHILLNCFSLSNSL